MSTVIDRVRLRELANKATPGPWRTWNDGCVGAPDFHIGGIFMPTNGSLPKQQMPDATYVAAVNPVVVLALLNELDVTEAELNTTRSQLQWLVDDWRERSDDYERKWLDRGARLDAVRELHRRCDCNVCDGLSCWSCDGLDYPCPTARALDGEVQ